MTVTSTPSSASGGTITVEHRGPLGGRIEVPGAKNSVLKLMAATLLADGVYRLSNVPAIADVTIMSDLLAAIGVTYIEPMPGRIAMTTPARWPRLRPTNSSNVSALRSTCSARCWAAAAR